MAYNVLYKLRARVAVLASINAPVSVRGSDIRRLQQFWKIDMDGDYLATMRQIMAHTMRCKSKELDSSE